MRAERSGVTADHDFRGAAGGRQTRTAPTISTDVTNSEWAQLSSFDSDTDCLGLADSEDLCAAGRADALCGGLAVLHRNLLGILDLLLGAALHAICLHRGPPFLYDSAKEASR